MTDFFALLGEPRQPWLDAKLLKKKFLALSAESHPDRVHNSNEFEKKTANDNYTQLNAAYQCLSNPRERLRHLLELESGHKPSDLEKVPAELMDCFMKIAPLFRDCDKFIAKKDKTTSPLLQARMFEQAQEWVDKLEVPEKKLGDAREKNLDELRQMNSIVLARLEEIYRLLGYYDRWLKQIQERRFRLLQ